MDKNLRIKLSLFGDKDAERGIKSVSDKGDELSKKRFTVSVGLKGNKEVHRDLNQMGVDLSIFGKKFAKATVGLEGEKQLRAGLDELGGRLRKFKETVAKAKVGVNGDDETRGKLLRMSREVEKLAEMTAKPDVDVEGFKIAMERLLKLRAELNKLARTRAVAHVKVDQSGGMPSAGTGGRGGGKSGFGSILGMFGGGDDKKGLIKTGLDMGHSIMDGLRASTPYAIAAIVTIAMSITPAVVTAGLGLGVAMGGGMIAFLTHPAFKANITKTFSGIMKSLGQDVTPMIGPLEKMFSQFGGFIQHESGPLKNMFKASLPFAQMFFNIMERFGKQLFPALTSVMRQMRPEIPLLTHAFVALLMGVVEFIKALGPGIKPSVQLFDQMMVGVKYSLGFIGHACGVMAKIFETTFNIITDKGHYVNRIFDQIGHWFAGPFVDFFKRLGSDITGLWNKLWNWAVGEFRHFKDMITNAVSDFTGDVKSFFNRISNDVEHIWQTMWNWVHDRFVAFSSWLQSAAKNVWHFITDIWHDIYNGVRNVWDNLWGWVHDRFVAFASWVASAATAVWHGLVGIWNSLMKGIKGIWDSLWNWAHDRFNSFTSWLSGAATAFWHDITKTFNTIKRDVSSVWSSLWSTVKRDGQAGINDVIGILNSVIGFVNRIASDLHLGIHIGTIGKVGGSSGGGPGAGSPKRSGNRLHQRGGFLDQDGTVGRFSAFADGGRINVQNRGDVNPVLVEGGETIVPRRVSGKYATMFKADGIPGYQNGGIVGADGMRRFTNGGKGDAGMGPRGIHGRGGTPPGELRGNNPLTPHGSWSSMLEDFRHGIVTKLVGPFQRGVDNTLDNTVGKLPMGNIVAGAGKSMVDEIVNAIAGKIQQKFDVGSGGGAIVDYARKFKHLPYVFGGNDAPGTRGTDCSGFVHMIYQHFGLAGGMPRTAASQYMWSNKTNQAIPGGLVFLKGSDGTNDTSGAGHVGIVSGKNKYISEYDTAVGWREGSFQEPHTFGLPHGWSAKRFNQKFGGGTVQDGGKNDFLNLVYVAKYFNSKGASKIASAAVAGTVAGESGGDPESQGSGGRGLIGWTPPGKLANSAFTGDKAHDLPLQTAAALRYYQENGSVAQSRGGVSWSAFKREKNLDKALRDANFFEGTKVTGSDIRAGTARSVLHRLHTGGWINEPVLGVGLRTGAGFSFGEQESEYITPASKMGRGGGGGTTIVNVACHPSNNPDEVATEIQKMLRNLRRHRGGASLGFE